jgi:SAM-dependent methyltransferase
VDGVPLLFRELDAWLASEGPEAIRRVDVDPELEAELCRRSGGTLARNHSLRQVYQASRAGPLQDRLRACVESLPGSVGEFGAGLGACARPDVVALDHNLALLRHHPGIRVAGDAADPPFLPRSFDALVLPNLLDSCADPGLVLAQAEALLRPRGKLVVTCAYAFQDGITPASRRFQPEQLRAAMSGESPFLGWPLALRLLEEEDRIPWPLHLGPRLVHTHATHWLVSEKVG